MRRPNEVRRALQEGHAGREIRESGELANAVGRMGADRLT